MASEGIITTEQQAHELGKIKDRGQGLLNLVETNDSLFALVGKPGTGKTWVARELCKLAIEQGLCYDTLWVSVTDAYRSETMPESNIKVCTSTEPVPNAVSDEPKIGTHSSPVPDSAAAGESKNKTNSSHMPASVAAEESKTRTNSSPTPASAAAEEFKTGTNTSPVPASAAPEESQPGAKPAAPEESKPGARPAAADSKPVTILETETGTKAATVTSVAAAEVSKPTTTLDAEEGSETTKEYVYRTKTGLLEDAIRSQLLSQSLTAEEWEAESLKKEENKKTIDQMVKRRLDEKRDGRKKFDLLLILDESLVVDKSRNRAYQNELWKTVWFNVRALLPSIEHNKLKTVITRTTFEGMEAVTHQIPGIQGEVTLQTPKEIKFGPLSPKESLDLLLGCTDEMKPEFEGRYREILEKIVGEKEHLPAVITMIAKALKYIAKHDSPNLKKALEMAAKYDVAATCVDPLIHFAYKMLPDEDLKHCLCHTIKLSRKYGGIHFVELITQWILEGYLDSFDNHIKQKYQRAHKVLMELIDRGMLKIQEGNFIVAEGVAVKLIDCLPEFLGKSLLGLAVVSESVQKKVSASENAQKKATASEKAQNKAGASENVQKNKDGDSETAPKKAGVSENSVKKAGDSENAPKKAGVSENAPKKIGVSENVQKKAGVSEDDRRLDLGKINQIDGMIKTICDPKKWEEVYTLLIDGNRLRWEVDEDFFARMKALNALAIFNSGLKSLDFTTSKLEKDAAALTTQSTPKKSMPKLLVIRNCDKLHTVSPIEKFKTLTVLEISGAKSAQSIGIGDMFNGMTQLQSLNLSGCQMKYLPSLSKLINLHFLILRDCSSLEKLPRINDLELLEMVDLSGATSLTFFPEQDLLKHPNLQMIDLSRTQIKRLPKFRNHPKLSLIKINYCKKVRIFPSLQKLVGLKILYLCGIEFRNFHCLPEASKASPLLIPKTISELYVKDCPTLICLPHISELENLEVLDFSGSSHPEFVISDDAFHDLKFLRELNLSDTKLKNLPALSTLCSLQKLVIKNCSLLEKLPEMKGLDHLEQLILSGCSKLDKLPNLKDFPKLEVLDISNTGIKVASSEIYPLTSAKVITDARNRLAYGASETRGKGQPLLLVNDGGIFKSLLEAPELNEVCIKNISIPSGSSNEQATFTSNGSSNSEVMFCDFHLRNDTRYSKILELQGFKSISDGLKEILGETEYISWVDHKFTMEKSKEPKPIKSLSNLDAGSLDKMKGCWIARCLEMVTIFGEDKDVKLGQKLEFLCLSNLLKVERLFSQKLQDQTGKSLENLKYLHLDCCPKLKFVFSSSHQIPAGLEVLEIKFCENLETVYKSVDKDGEDGCTLPKLKKLVLFELPELMSTGFSVTNVDFMEADAQISGCTKLTIQKFGGLKLRTAEINVVE